MQITRGMDMDPDTLDYSMFGAADLVNVVLQRSDVLHDIPGANRLIKAWQAGDHGPLGDLVVKNGTLYAQRAARQIKQEFDQLRGAIDHHKPVRIADIGCGYAMFGLFAYHAYGSDLLLIDIENNEHAHFGFQDEGAAYADLAVAQAFLAANGVPAGKVTTWNPETEDLDADVPADLALSLLSCGFHYPVDMYMPYFRFGVRKGGAIILDVRAGQFGQTKRRLAPLGQLTVLAGGTRHKRVMITKKGVK